MPAQAELICTVCGQKNCALHRKSDHADACGCGHDHSHDHDHGDEGLSLKTLAAPVLGAVVFVTAVVVGGAYAIWLFLLAYLLIGWPVLAQTLRLILKGRARALMGEAFLMTLATAGAFVIGQYAEGVAVMLFYRVGESLQSHAVGKSRGRVRALMALKPDKATVVKDGKTAAADPADVMPGERILLRPGERVPLDGVIESGSTRVNTSSLTGESVPRSAGPGDHIFAGYVNEGGVVTVMVTKAYGESAVARILELAENAAAKKSRMESFITRFARVYTPIVIALAALLAALPPLFGIIALNQSLYRALSFLVISCPCALVLSVPLTFFGGIGAGSKAGILFKGAAYLEAMARLNAVAFDKTGTLTKGVFEVADIRPVGMDEDEFLRRAAHCEHYSAHPIARGIIAKYAQGGGVIDEAAISRINETAGGGIRAMVGGDDIVIGTEAMLRQNGVAPEQAIEKIRAAVHMAVNGTYSGYLVLSDIVRPEAAEALNGLKTRGIDRLVMLTGDSAESAAAVSRGLEIGETHSGLLPGDKAALLEGLLNETRRANAKATVAFVGDGVNDAPVLALADAGIAMGGLGSEAAIEAADVVIMDDDLNKLPLAVGIARRTMRVASQNIAFVLAAKAAVLVLGALGLTGLWLAIFADVGVSLLAVLNALRALSAKIVSNPRR